MTLRLALSTMLLTACVPAATFETEDAGAVDLASSTSPNVDLASAASAPVVDLASALDASSAVPLAGLVSHWKFDEGMLGPVNNGAAWIYDSIDKKNQGRIQVDTASLAYEADVPTVGFADPYAMRVETGYVYLNLNGPMPRVHELQTVALWCKVVASAPSEHAIFLHESDASLAYKATFMLDVGAGEVGVTVSEPAHAVASLTAPVVAGWHHVAYTWDGSEVHLFVDGAQAAHAAASFVRDDYVKMLPSQFPANEAALDDLRFYDRALDASEVAALASGQP